MKLTFYLIVGLSFLTSCGPTVVLDAKLIDDLSAIDLTLYEDSTFYLQAHSPFGTTYEKEGSYKLLKNQIIFLEHPYYNDFIPDTIYIIKDKLIREFNEDGTPNEDFARYFEITKNKI